MKKTILTILATTATLIAIKLFSSNTSIKYDHNLATSLKESFDKGDLDGLIKKAEDIYNQENSNISALIGLATAYAMKGSVGYAEKENGDKAIYYTDQIIALDPNNSEAYRIKAYAYEIQELYEQAYSNYEKAVQLDPNNHQAWSNMGHAYDLQGDFNKANQYYLKSLEINPKGEHALLNISRLLIRMRDYEAANNYLNTLAQSTKSSRFKAEAYQVLAELYRIKGQYPEAIMAIENSISNDPNIPQAWVTRGRLTLRSIIGVSDQTEKSTMLDNVEEYANKALSINKNQSSAYQLLSDLMLLKGDNAKNKEYKDKALSVVEADITLGQKEKQAMRAYLTAEIKVEN